MASDRQPLPVGAGDQRARRPGLQRHGNQQGKDGFGAVEINRICLAFNGGLVICQPSGFHLKVEK